MLATQLRLPVAFYEEGEWQNHDDFRWVKLSPRRLSPPIYDEGQIGGPRRTLLCHEICRTSRGPAIDWYKRVGPFPAGLKLGLTGF